MSEDKLSIQQVAQKIADQIKESRDMVRNKRIFCINHGFKYEGEHWEQKEKHLNYFIAELESVAKGMRTLETFSLYHDFLS